LSAGIVLIGREQTRTAQTAEDLRRRDYVQRINLALHELQEDGNVVSSERLLDGCPEDLRGWEWNYVKRQACLDRFTYRGHLGDLLSAAGSPGSSFQRDPPSLSTSIKCVAISPDGSWAASAAGIPWNIAHRTDRAEIRLWDIEGGRDR